MYRTMSNIKISERILNSIGSMLNRSNSGPFCRKRWRLQLQNDRGTSYSAYIQVQNELSAAYDEIRDEAAKAKWGVSYEEMEDEDPRRKLIRQVYPQKISEAEPKNYGGNK